MSEMKNSVVLLYGLMIVFRDNSRIGVVFVE